MFKGSIERCMACLVDQGYSQQEGLDYDEIFSPVVVRSKSVCSVIALASMNDSRLDITTIFFHGDLQP